jgi:protein NrfD
MPEVDVTGTNPLVYPEMATWEWHVGIYLFLGGLVAGLMILSGAIKLMRARGFDRSLLIADVAGLPLLAVGMLFLWIDLANRWNAWRFFTTFEVTSPMSWGSWILLLSMLVLFLRLLTRVPAPRPAAAQPARKGFGARLRSSFRGVWAWIAGLGQRLARGKYALDGVTLVLGIGLGFYTGILLSSISARPMWSSAVLAPLFLVSGLASAGAFLCLFIPEREHKSLVPFSVLLCGVELVLILAYAINQVTGTEAVQRAGGLIFGGDFTLPFWGLVVFMGLLLPMSAEGFELANRHLPAVLGKVPPVLKLAGSMALRLVIVYAGLRSFV